MKTSELQFNVDDRVHVPGGAIGTVVTIYPDRPEGQQVLVYFVHAPRRLYSIAELRFASADEGILHDRYPVDLV